MAEWASILVGLGVGVVVTLIGAYSGDWLVDRRERRKARRDVIAKLWVLFVDAHPKALEDRRNFEAQVRQGDLLWQRWVSLRESLLELVAAERSRELLEPAQRAVSKIGVAIEAWRKAARANQWEKSERSRYVALMTADAARDDAVGALNDLHDAFG